jgi:hypothetical protein
VVLLDGVQLGQPAPQRPVTRGLAGAGEGADLGLHRVAVRAQRQLAAVGEPRPVRRIQPGQAQVLGQWLADRGERFFEELRHGQHARAGVHGVAVEAPLPGAAARDVRLLQERDPASRPEQVQGRRKPGQPGPDDDDVVGRAVDRAHVSTSAGWP